MRKLSIGVSPLFSLSAALLIVADPALAEAQLVADPTLAEAQPVPPPAPPAVPSPEAPAAPELKSLGTDALMAQAKQLHDQLEYDQVLPLVREVLARDGVAIEQTLDAYVMEGSCLAIMGNPIDAEAPFRRLLRGRPDFDLAAETPPKIMSVFRKVQAEERAITEQMEALTRKRIVDGMALSGQVAGQLEGGRPVKLDYMLKDPSVAARTVRVQYRKKGEPAYSSLALLNDGTGRWRGQISGEWTANDAGMVLEFYVEALDAKGPLLQQGTQTEPLVRHISAGQVDLSSPPPLPTWSVWVGAGTTAALAVAGAGFGAGMLATQRDYTALGQLARTEPQDGSDLRAKREFGETLSVTANSLFVASGLAAAATVVAGAFFTDWEGRSEERDDVAAPTIAAPTVAAPTVAAPTVAAPTVAAPTVAVLAPAAR